MNKKIIIKNGTVVNYNKTSRIDILLFDGKIQNLAKNINLSDARIIDANGKYIFPGAIDPHVHLNLPTPAGYSSDDFAAGSKAALWGGTTALIDFVTAQKGQSLTDALALRKAEAENANCDYSFHLSPVEWTENTEQELKECIAAGITSFKMYMAYKESIGLNNSAILNVMKVVGKAGGMVTLHCELGDEITDLRNELASQNKLSPEFHPVSRPAYTESEAVKEAIELAKEANCPVYIVHTSTADSVKHIEDAQKNGQVVYSETCPQYLILDDSKYIGEFNNTAPYVMSPPLRKLKDQDTGLLSQPFCKRRHDGLGGVSGIEEAWVGLPALPTVTGLT